MQVMQWAPILATWQVYLTCITGVSQVCLKSQVYCNPLTDRYICMQLSLHTILKFDSAWKGNSWLAQFQCCKNFELESSLPTSGDSKNGFGELIPNV